MTRPIAVAPDSYPYMYGPMRDAVIAGGGTLAPPDIAEGLIWADPGAADRFPDIAGGMDHLDWVQLPYAGVETFVQYLDPRFRFTCGKGVYAEPVAEHALALALAGMRDVWRHAPGTDWGERHGVNLLGARVAILGAGGITDSLVRLLEPWGAEITVVRRSTVPYPGVYRTLQTSELMAALTDADVVFVAWALTPETAGLLDRDAFETMASNAWLVNVGRGGHVVTDDLVDALRSGAIAGAGLDVTDPEPLPHDHPLRSIPNCIVTPHIGNTPAMGLPLICDRITENVRRFIAGTDLIGTVDPAAGY